MAKGTIDNDGKLSITMDDGEPVLVAADYESIALYSGGRADLIHFPDSAEWWFTTGPAKLRASALATLRMAIP